MSEKISAKVFQKFLELYQDYNSHTNISSIREPEQIWQKHFLDSLAISPYLAEKSRIVDIGSGAGFPAIPLAMSFPGLTILAIESNNKKTKFIQMVKQEFKLKNLEIAQARAEELAHQKDLRESFDTVTTRAFAELQFALEYMVAFAKVGAQIVTYKKYPNEEEFQNSQKIISELFLNFETSHIYGHDKQLMFFRKLKTSPKNIPRTNSQITKSIKLSRNSG